MKVASHFLYLYFIIKVFFMRSLLVVLAVLFAFSMMAQKPAKPIFNQKSFPKFNGIDSLSKKTKDDYLLDRIFDLGTDKPSIAQSNIRMPIFEPKYQTSMPIYGVDSTNTLFIKVYPINKD